MYYRVAILVNPSPLWQWKSTVLGSLDALFQWLRLFRTLPHNQLRVFSSSSREGLVEQLEQENQGLASSSVTAAQFLSERKILPPVPVRSASVREGASPAEGGAIAVISQQPSNEWNWEGSVLGSRSRSVLDRRRQELESGPGGDHDRPYNFGLPLSLPQVLAWMNLLVKVRSGEIEP